MPEIRIALEALFTQKETCHAFTLGEMRHSQTGASMKVGVFVCNEFIGAVLEGTAHGIDESTKRLMASGLIAKVETARGVKG